jgi:hypothetical protein
MSKLTTENKTEISFSNKTTRALGIEFNIHHSRVAKIKNEAKTALINYFNLQASRVGRPIKEIDLRDTKIMEQAVKIRELEIEMQLKDDYNN